MEIRDEHQQIGITSMTPSIRSPRAWSQVREDEDLALRIVARVAGALVAFQLADSAVRGHRGVRDCRSRVDDARAPRRRRCCRLPKWPVMAGIPNTVVALAPGTALRTLPLEPLEPLEPWNLWMVFPITNVPSRPSTR